MDLCQGFQITHNCGDTFDNRITDCLDFVICEYSLDEADDTVRG